MRRESLVVVMAQAARALAAGYFLTGVRWRRSLRSALERRRPESAAAEPRCNWGAWCGGSRRLRPAGSVLHSIIPCADGHVLGRSAAISDATSVGILNALHF